MPLRTRHKDERTELHWSTDRPFEAPRTGVTLIGKETVCHDTVGEPDKDHPLTIDSTNLNPLILNGETSGYFFKEYPIITSFGTPILPEKAQVSMSAFAAYVVSDTNPARSDVQLPVSIRELRDFPRTIEGLGLTILRRHRYKDVPKALADYYLSQEFGMKPLLGDLKKVLEFGDLVENRIDEFNRLTEKGGLKRRRRGPTHKSTSTTSTKAGYSRGVLFYVKFRRSHKSEVWGTVRWKPKQSFVRLTSDDKRDLARRLVLGLDPSQITENIWESIPWSWLVDWFSNIGDLLGALNNRVAMLPSHVCVMRHSTSTNTTLPVTHLSWVSTKEGVTTRDIKERHVVFPYQPTVHIPFLTGRQVSILGSLGISRSHK